MMSTDKDARLSCGTVGPRVQCVGTLLTPEAASVVEPPIGQVPLHKVNVFATDPTDAADGAACGSQSSLWRWPL